MADAKQEIFAAIKDGDAERVRALVREDPAVATARDENGVSALLQAKYHMRDDLAAILLEAKPELDVFEAATLGKPERVTALLREKPEEAQTCQGTGLRRCTWHASSCSRSVRGCCSQPERMPMRNRRIRPG